MAVKNSAQKLRFILVGIANTTIDFTTLFLLTSVGFKVIVANIISTSLAFCFSFFANKRYTFKTTGGNIKREIALFIIITLFGLWVIQTIVIQLVSPLLSLIPLSEGLVLLIAKIAATCASLVWNYTLYARFVFIEGNRN